MSERADRTIRAMVGVLAAAVVLVAGALWLLPRGGAGSTAEEPRQASVVVGDAPAPRAQLPAPAQVDTYQIFGGKNPFQRPDRGADEAATTTTSVPGDGGGTTTSTTQPGGVTGTTSTTTTTIQPGTDPVRGTTIALVEVFVENGVDTALVRVNGQLFEVVEGEVFAGRFEVVDIDVTAGCADFLFGDRAFTLCEGQEIIK